jgi:hypothetical protein
MLTAACATGPAGPTTVVMPPPNKPLQAFQDDQVFCKQFADQQIGGAKAAQDKANQQLVAGMIIGALLGAATGAALGRTGGSAGAGAAVGLLAGTSVGSDNAAATQATLQEQYDIAYSQCMYSRGNQVPGYAATAAASPPPPPPGVAMATPQPGTAPPPPGSAVTPAEPATVTPTAATSAAPAPLLVDDFTTDHALNEKLWIVNGPVAAVSLPHFDNPPATLATPALSFSSSLGLGIGDVTGDYVQGGVQSVEPLRPPFILIAQGRSAGPGAPLQLAVATQDGGGGIALNGGRGAKSDLAGFGYAAPNGAGSEWHSAGKMAADNPTPGSWYQLMIAVDAGGNASLSVRAGEHQLGQGSAKVGTGPFYVILSQGTAEQQTAKAATSYWKSIRVENVGAPSAENAQPVPALVATGGGAALGSPAASP